MKGSDSYQEENAATPNAGYVRSKMPQSRLIKRDLSALVIFGADIAAYVATFWIIILLPYWPLKITAIFLNGLSIGALFVVGHDACHGSFTSRKYLNHLIGRIAFFPSLNNFTAWEVAHNQLHHGYTNLKGVEDVYVPLSKEEYDSLSRFGKAIQRFYRSNVGIVFYYQIEVWLKRTIIPRKFDLSRMQFSAFLLDLSMILAYLGLEIVVITLLVPRVEDYFHVGNPRPIMDFVLAVFLPFSFWIYLYVQVTLLHHTNPNVPWFDKRSEWNYFNSQIKASVHVSVPKLFGVVTNNVFRHTAHHADVRIPLYNLRESQSALESAFPGAITVQSGLFRSTVSVLKACKLYDYDNHQWLDFSGKPTTPRISIKNSVQILFVTVSVVALLMSASSKSHAQGLNYPGNSPVMNTGVGNARRDADNLFTRNNIAGLTEIEDEDDADDGGALKRSKWRFMGEVQGTYFRYERRFPSVGLPSALTSAGTVAVPNASGEVTFTSKSRRFGFGVGLSQEFGFESKLKDPATLGSQAQFFDTKVASQDITVAGAVRLHKQFSVGGSVIFGRGFLLQIGTIPDLAAVGIIRQSRLDVAKIGGVACSVGANWRPAKQVTLGINYKSQREYKLKGTLDAFQPVVTPVGLQLVAFKLPVRTRFRFPAVVETGIAVRPVKRLLIEFDYRYFLYKRSLDTVTVIDSSTNSVVASQPINARNVKLLLLGGYYELNDSHKLNFGTGYTTNGIPDATFNPGIMNTGARSLTGGFSKKINGSWWNASVTGYFGLKRVVTPVANSNFYGDYTNHGFTIGLGLRR